MRTGLLLFLLFGSTAFNNLNAQKNKTLNNNDSYTKCNSYMIWFDAGKYFTSGNYIGDFEPTHSLRVGIGKSFYIYQIYGFIELTSYKYDPPDALSPPFLSSNKRSDIAFYAMGSLYRTLFLGIGLYHSHQDNIIGRDRSGAIISETGDHSHLGFYSLIGLGQQIDISNSISIPVGIYYQNQEHIKYSSDLENISIRIGIIFTL